MLKKKWFRFAVMVVVVCAVVFAVMNGAGIFSDKILTARPEAVVSAEYITVPASFVREETVLTQSGDRIISYDVSDGERVRADTVVAKLYAVGSDLSAVRKIKSLTEKIESLKALQSGDLSYRQDALKLENDINDLILSVAAMSASGDYADIPEAADRLTHYFNIKQLLLNENEGFDGKIAEYEAELASLKAVAPKAEKTVRAGAVGSFTSRYDGYENVLTYAALTSQNVADAVALIKDSEPSPEPEGYVGKTVNDYSWHLAAVLDAAVAKDYPVGSQVKRSVPGAGDRLFAAETVYNDSFRGDALVIFEGSFGTEIFTNVRKVEAKILRSSENVLAVPSTALLQNDEGVTGVYVLVGQQVVFKQAVFVKYEGDMAYIKPPSGSSSAISQYDEVIYSGKNLFDGKVV